MKSLCTGCQKVIEWSDGHELKQHEAICWGRAGPNAFRQIDEEALRAAQDAVNHPSHYKQGGIETIDAIEAWGLGFHLGNAVKYISRAGKKDPAKLLEDLKKARWYLDRAIAMEERTKL